MDLAPARRGHKAGMLPDRIGVIAGGFAALALAQLSRQDLATAKRLGGNFAPRVLPLALFERRQFNFPEALACSYAHGIEQTTGRVHKMPFRSEGLPHQNFRVRSAENVDTPPASSAKEVKPPRLELLVGQERRF